MTSFYLEFFKSHPDPMWIFDFETLAFLDVNDAALELYGYSEDEFLKLTIENIRPGEDLATLKSHMTTLPQGINKTGPWRHLRKDGSVVFVEALAHSITFRDRPARLVRIQDISELLAAREETAAVSSRLAEVLEQVQEAFYTLDREWRFTFANQAALALLASPRGALLGYSAWTLFPQAIGTKFERQLRHAVASGEAVAFLDYYPSFAKWFSVRAYPMSEGIAVFFQDVTESRAQQAQLDLLETAIARLNDIVVLSAADGEDPLERRIVYVNDAFVKRTGYSREEIVGRSSRSLSGPNTDPHEIDRIRAALRANRSVRAELLRYAKSGEEYWVDLEITPIADDSGRYTRWITVERDVTERRKIDEARRVSEERFRLIARATSDIVWDWDLVTGEMWRNEGMQKVFGYDPGTLAEGAGAWSQAVHPDDRERVLNGLRAVIAGAETEWSDDYRLIRADGAPAQVSDRGFVIRDGAGKAVRMVGSMVDVTDRLKLEAQLRQAQRLETVGQLTGGVAHDFNNLLTVIIGNAEMLSERLAGEPQLKALAAMAWQAAERGAELTNRLLAFARRQPLDPKAMNVGALAASMDGLLRRTIGEQYDIEFVRGAGLWDALIDGAQLESALLNLCINARDAMPDGGHLTIETANAHIDADYAAQYSDVAQGQYIMIAVSDTGKGMDEDTLSHAFEPFFTTKEIGRGSGLGLSMVYGFVKQSKGHVKIYSELGQGTTVRLYLPRAASAGEQATPAARPAPDPGGAEAILLVEDDHLVRAHVTGLLESLGYRVTAAENGQRGLEQLMGPEPFDLLFTDVVMPGGIGGRQLADAAKVIRPGLPVLFTSGYTENAIVHHGRLDQGVHLLQKPYRRNDLAAKVRAALDEATAPRRT